jgi:AAA+ ATPase superfamily predicted ATPase
VRIFINREKELEALSAAYKDSKVQFIVIYGKRRVGKGFVGSIRQKYQI